MAVGPAWAQLRTAWAARPSHQCGPEQSLRTSTAWRPEASSSVRGSRGGASGDEVTRPVASR